MFVCVCVCNREGEAAILEFFSDLLVLFGR